MSKKGSSKSFLYFVKEGLTNILVHGFMSFAAVAVMAACLLITGSFTLVAYNIEVLIEDLESQNEIAVFIDDSLSREDAVKLEAEIKKIENIATVEFVPKEQAFDEYLEQLEEDAYIMEGLKEDNPLRDGYRITMYDISKHGETTAAINQIQGIGGVQSRKDISDRLLQIKNVVNAISMTLIALLGAVSLFIISNTVKLAMFYRREEIAIMKMIGATNTFIRLPFMVEGITLGLLGGLFAFGAQMGVYQYITNGLVEGTGILKMVEFSQFGLPLFGIFMLGGTLLGIIGSVFTIQKFMKV